jgi:hypothetical protein
VDYCQFVKQKIGFFALINRWGWAWAGKVFADRGRISRKEIEDRMPQFRLWADRGA